VATKAPDQIPVANAASRMSPGVTPAPSRATAAPE
jgi:hypothetical protein